MSFDSRMHQQQGHRSINSHNGAQGRNRTTDTRIFSPLLYRLSYLAEGALFNLLTVPNVKAIRVYRRSGERIPPA